MTIKTPFVSFDRLTKSFGPVVANNQLSFDIFPGTIHAIIGENGAGKSIAMKQLYGMTKSTSGEIRVKGAPVAFRSPRDAARSGIGMVHQHFMLSPVHTALQNMLLAAPLKASCVPPALRLLPWHKTLKLLERLTRDVGFKIPWQQHIQDLPVGVQQQIEISKLLVSEAELMIFDEPTAVLSPIEIKTFLEMLKTLKAQGKTIVLITHKLQEVLDVADVITVMRAGRHIVTLPAGGATVQELADLMVGRHVDLAGVEPTHVISKDLRLELRSINLMKSSGSKRNLDGWNEAKKFVLKDVSLSVHAGEIVGIAGVQGNGQTELLDLLYDPRAASKRLAGAPKLSAKLSAKLSICGLDAAGWSSADIRNQGVGIVGADRHHESVILNATLWQNFMLGESLKGVFFTPRQKLRERTKELVQAFDVRPGNVDDLMESLSGGNQQKFVMGRELRRNPKLLLCSEPTRGVDVGSIEQIHGAVRSARAAGMGILLVSSQLEELMALADRILVMRQGKIVGEFHRGNFEESKIGRAMVGVT